MVGRIRTKTRPRRGAHWSRGPRGGVWPRLLVAWILVAVSFPLVGNVSEDIRQFARQLPPDPNQAYRLITKKIEELDSEHDALELRARIFTPATRKAGGYNGGLGFNRNFLIWLKGLQAARLYADARSHVYDDLSEWREELARDRKNRMEELNSWYNSRLGSAKRKYLKKKKFYKWIKKKVKTKQGVKIRKKKKYYWATPRSGRKKYASARSWLNGEYAKKEEKIREWYLAQKEKLRFRMYTARSRYFHEARRLLLSGLLSPWREMRAVSYLQLAVLYGYGPDPRRRVGLSTTGRMSLKKALNLPSKKRLLPPEPGHRYYEAGHVIAKVLRGKLEAFLPLSLWRKHREFFAHLFPDEWVSGGLILNQENELLLEYFHLKQKLNPDRFLEYATQNILHLQESEYWNLSYQEIDRTRDWLHKQKWDPARKYLEYTRLATHRAHTHFLAGRFERAIRLNKKLVGFTRRAIGKLGGGMRALLSSRRDPRTGQTYLPAEHYNRYWLARYYSRARQTYGAAAKPKDWKRPFVYEHTDAEQAAWKKLEAEIREFRENGPGKDFVLTSKEAWYRLRLIHSTIALEISSTASEEISQDIMYETQADRELVLEYYATLNNGWGKLGRGYWRQGRVDFTKADTILMGNLSHRELEWMTGTGKAYVELEQYKSINKDRRYLNKDRRQSWGFHKSYLKRTLRSLYYGGYWLNLYRLQSAMPYYITPGNHLRALSEIARLYKKDEEADQLEKLRNDLNDFNQRRAWSRYVNRLVRERQWRILYGNPGKVKQDKLESEIKNYRQQLYQFEWNRPLSNFIWFNDDFW